MFTAGLLNYKFNWARFQSVDTLYVAYIFCHISDLLGRCFGARCGPRATNWMGLLRKSFPQFFFYLLIYLSFSENWNPVSVVQLSGRDETHKGLISSELLQVLGLKNPLNEWHLLNVLLKVKPMWRRFPQTWTDIAKLAFQQQQETPTSALTIKYVRFSLQALIYRVLQDHLQVGAECLTPSGSKCEETWKEFCDLSLNLCTCSSI